MSEHPNDRANLQYAIDAASQSASQGGIPIGAALIFNVESDNLMLTAGHNRHIQNGDPTQHAEKDAFDALEQAISAGGDDEMRNKLDYLFNDKGIQPGDLYQHLTLYTTMSPCPNCAKQTIERNVRRVIVGDNMTYFGNEKMLADAGIEVVTMQTDDCVRLINQFIDARPDIAQQIGVQKVEL